MTQCYTVRDSRPRKAADILLHCSTTSTTTTTTTTTTFPTVTMVATTLCFCLMLVVLGSTAIVQDAAAYTCSGSTDLSPVTMNAGSHSIDGCTLSNKVIINVDAIVVIKNTIFDFIGQQLQINDNVDVTITGSTFEDAGSAFSITIVSFGASAKITIDGNTFKDKGYIYLPTTSLSASTVLKIINNNLQFADRGGAETPGNFVSCSTPSILYLQEGGALDVSGNIATDSLGSAIFNSVGGLRVLYIDKVDVQSTTPSGGVISITKNVGWELLVDIIQGVFTASSAGKIVVSDNTQKCINCRNDKGRIARIFKDPTLVPVGFSMFVERNSFENRLLSTFCSTATGGQSVYMLDMYTSQGFDGYLGIRHNTIYFEHCDTSNAMAPFYLELNNLGSTIMKGILEVSDNVATLHTPLVHGINFLSVINLDSLNAQVWILRNTITYTNQAKNIFVSMDHKNIGDGSRILISRNVLWGGSTTSDSRIFDHASGSVLPTNPNTVLEISHNYIDCFKEVMKIDNPQAYARIVFSYNVVNVASYQSGNSVNLFDRNLIVAEVCNNRYNNVYFTSTQFTAFYGSATVVPCPARTLTDSLSLRKSPSLTSPETLVRTQSHTNSNTTTILPANITLNSTTATTTTATSTTTVAPDGRVEGFNTTETAVTVVVPKGVADEVFIAGVTVGSVATPLALLETASSIQMAAIFTVMPCRTMDGSRTVMSHVLSPLQLSGTNASDLLGSFVLLVSISAAYMAVSLLVLRLASRFGSQEGDAPDMRVFKAKLFLWYPRVPMTVAVLLLPGMSFESCSLLYGVKNGGPWWERVIGAVGLLVSLAIVAYHIGVGVVVGRIARKQLEENPTTNTAATEAPYVDDEALPVKTTNHDDHHDAVIVFDDDDDEPKGDGCEIPDRDAINSTSATPQEDDKEAPNDTTKSVVDVGGVTSIDGPQSSVYFVSYTEEAKARVPAILGTMLLATGRWNKHVLRSMRFVVVNCRRDVVSYVCAHNCVRIVLVSIVAAVDGKNVVECHVVQGIIAAICFLHALLILFARVYRVPILTPLQAGQSVCVGLLACAAFIQNANAQQAFVIIMMLLSLLTTILCGVVALLEIRVNRKVSAPADLDDSQIQK